MIPNTTASDLVANLEQEHHLLLLARNATLTFLNELESDPENIRDWGKHCQSSTYDELKLALAKAGRIA